MKHANMELDLPCLGLLLRYSLSLCLFLSLSLSLSLHLISSRETKYCAASATDPTHTTHTTQELCPSLIIIPCHFDKYKAASEQTRKIFTQFDPQFRSFSLDEASLHLTPYLREHPHKQPDQVAEDIRNQVFQTTQLTCSIGSSFSFLHLFQKQM